MKYPDEFPWRQGKERFEGPDVITAVPKVLSNVANDHRELGQKFPARLSPRLMCHASERARGLGAVTVGAGRAVVASFQVAIPQSTGVAESAATNNSNAPARSR